MKYCVKNNGIKYVFGHLKVPPDEVKGLELYSWLRMANPKLRYDKNHGISIALMQKEGPLQASARFVNVGSLEDCIKEAEQLGGIVVKDKEEISEGCYAVLEDPHMAKQINGNK